MMDRKSGLEWVTQVEKRLAELEAERKQQETENAKLRAENERHKYKLDQVDRWVQALPSWLFEGFLRRSVGIWWATTVVGVLISIVVTIFLYLLLIVAFGLTIPLASSSQDTPATKVNPVVSLTPANERCPFGCVVETYGCRIKGNVNTDGSRVVFMDWHSNYKLVEIEPEKGDRWFCDGQDAKMSVAAGTQ